MPNIHANGIDIEYEALGESTSEPLLLIMGFGRQMIAWPDALCGRLVDRGFRVIRYDNRDVGLTTMIRDGGDPSATASNSGAPATPPYTIDDMADDAAGLLTALGVGSAHVVGASMGGAIAQSLAIRRPEMVLSLTSIMSSPGDPSVAGSDPEVLKLIAEPPVDDREAAIERAVRIAVAIGSKGLVDEARARDAATRAWDRNPSYDGLARQRAAMAASHDRTAQLRQLSVPALVIHGEADPLVSVRAGEATAAAIPGARLLTIPGMGHDLPEAVWPEVVDGIDEVARRAKSAV
jgi:pimeloyl-ACP methyl ester carboxylesterase